MKLGRLCMLHTLKGMLLMAVVAAFLVPAEATSVVFDLDIEFSGATPPAGAAPWLRATFDDFGGTGTVDLTMTALNLTGTEFINSWYFNLNPLLDPTLLTVANVDLSAVGSSSVSLGADMFKADGDGLYDILFGFPPPPGAFADKFTAGESVVVRFSLAGLTASDFDFSSAPAPGGGSGPFLSAAHVQGIGATGDDSGWIAPSGIPPTPPPPAPEFPALGWLVSLGGGLLGMGILNRKYSEK